MHCEVTHLGTPVITFQSAPDREVGRCHAQISQGGHTRMFQSAPDREVGRCAGGVPMTVAAVLFQSAPDREVGRCDM